jgi:hypothetical protein
MGCIGMCQICSMLIGCIFPAKIESRQSTRSTCHMISTSYKQSPQLEGGNKGILQVWISLLCVESKKISLQKNKSILRHGDASSFEMSIIPLQCASTPNKTELMLN